MRIATGTPHGYHRAMAQHPYPWREAFLAALRVYPVIQHACDAVEINRSTAERLRKLDEDFAKAMDEAMEAGVDRAEKEAFARGVTGWEEPVFHKGEIVGHVLKKSDAMLSLVLKGRRKAVYAERTEITGADGGPVAHSDETTRAARLAHLIDVARLRKEADELG